MREAKQKASADAPGEEENQWWRLGWTKLERQATKYVNSSAEGPSMRRREIRGHNSQEHQSKHVDEGEKRERRECMDLQQKEKMGRLT